MNVFFCDLHGTFTGAKDNRVNALKKLVNNLTVLCNNLGIEELLFDFVTTEDMSYLLPYIKEIEKYLVGTPIIMANQFSNREKYYNGEIEKIEHTGKIEQICSICRDKQIERIIFADDTYLQHLMIRSIFRSLRPDIEFISLLPSSNKLEYNEIIASNKYGIDGLNETIELYLSSLNKKRKK